MKTKMKFNEAMGAAELAYERVGDEAYANGFATALSIAMKKGMTMWIAQETMNVAGMSLAQMKFCGANGHDYEELVNRFKIKRHRGAMKTVTKPKTKPKTRAK
jgi:hypothetical protein